MKYIKLFENHSDYESAESGLLKPNVSHCVQENEVHYNAASNHDYSLDYFTIIPLQTCQLRFYSRSNASLTYSIDGGNSWSALTINDTVGMLDGTTIEVPAGTKVLWKGNNTKTGTFDTEEPHLPIKVEGNIMSLLYGDNFQSQTSLEGKTYAFQNLFSEDAVTNVVDVRNLILPATTLAPYCYSNMFQGCTSITTAPELPAATLADSCYSSMFDGCTGLTKAPELPATTLADNCYQYMFRSTRITTAPELPATTLANYCYYEMFNSCISLTTAPALSATTLANACYARMFSDCASLTIAPELPATTLANGCYYGMFSNCTSLTSTAIVPNSVAPIGYAYCCDMYLECNVPRSSDYDSVAYDGCGGD